MEEAQCNERPKMNVYKNDGEYVWLTLRNYEELKERMKRLEDELYVKTHTGMAKVITRTAFGNALVEFHPSDKAVEMVNNGLLDANKKLSDHLTEKRAYWLGIEHEIGRLKAKINRLEWWKF